MAYNGCYLCECVYRLDKKYLYCCALCYYTLTVGPVLFFAYSIQHSPQTWKHTPLHIGVEKEVWLFCSLRGCVIPPTHREMQDTPSPIWKTERTSKLQTSARLVHMLLQTSFLALWERVKGRKSLSPRQPAITDLLLHIPALRNYEVFHLKFKLRFQFCKYYNTLPKISSQNSISVQLLCMFLWL